jgi:tetratricopeptide (TPR) repeat protein
MNGEKDQRRDVIICVVLALVTLALYSPVGYHEFVDYDDPPYVTDNSHVSGGLTLSGISWAFTAYHSGNWHPLTWISLMLDAQIYGLKAGGFLITNLLLHLSNTLLLYLLWRRMTGCIWRSATLAALFAWHPTHVESVAWISERKDVLCGLFWILTLWAYASYARTGKRKSLQVAWGLFVAALMSKPMAVTLPFALLLMDYWPLNRWRAGANLKQSKSLFTWQQLVWEKWPFFALLPVSFYLTFRAQAGSGAVETLESLPLSGRLANAIVSYTSYLEKMAWPIDLSVFYPHPHHWAPGRIAYCFAVLALITALAVMGWKKRPWLFTGWFWYLGTLVPVIGLIQVGVQSMADRYTYLPSIGLFAAVVWGGGALLYRLRLPLWTGQALACSALVACLAFSHTQISYWKDSRALFQHALAVTGENVIVLTNLGVEAVAEHRNAEARRYIEAALRLNPNDFYTWSAMALVSERMGNDAEAVNDYQVSLKINPNQSRPRFHAGRLLAKLGKEPEAIKEYEEALRLQPDVSDGWYLLGNLYAHQNRFPDAVGCYIKSLELLPDQADVHQNLAIALDAAGHPEEAVGQFNIALQLQPDLAAAHLGYGLLLMRMGKADESIAQFKEATRLKPDDSKGFFQLGVTYASQHRGVDAVAPLRRAIQLRPDWPAALSILSMILATEPNDSVRNGAEALRMAKRAIELGGESNPMSLDALAAAQAETGEFKQAVVTAEKALAVAQAGKMSNLAEVIALRLKAYRAGQPWRETNAVQPSRQP